jgi:hypothetical protein
MDQVNYAVIGFDGLQLLIPQTGIATIEMIDSMESGDAGVAAVGKLSSGGREWPVYVLDANFNLLNQCAASNKYCVAFNLEGQASFALTCDAVSSLTLKSHDEIRPMQPCMRNPGNPVEAMMLKDGQLMLVSQVGAMQQFLFVDEAA